MVRRLNLIETVQGWAESSQRHQIRCSSGMENVKKIAFILSLLLAPTFPMKITINPHVVKGPLTKFWKSTGFSPSLFDQTSTRKFLTSKEVEHNLAIISSLPNQGIEFVRIHWLLNLLYFNSDDTINWDLLDKVIDWIVEDGMKPIIELMVNPETVQKKELIKNGGRYFWKWLTSAVAQRYVDKYGRKYVSEWRFETWNEPDLKMYNVLNFGLEEYIDYVTGCAEGINSVLPEVEFGGPAGLFKNQSSHPLCWGFLNYCNNDPKRCNLKYISLHKKGNGSSSEILNEMNSFHLQMKEEFPNLAMLPLINEFTDAEGNAHFVQKPVYAAMGLLSMLGEDEVQTIFQADNKFSIIATRTNHYNNDNKAVGLNVMIVYSSDTMELNDTECELELVTVLPDWKNARYALYKLENRLPNPKEIWKKFGSPTVPSITQLTVIRQHQEPKRVAFGYVNEIPFSIKYSAVQPSITFLQICDYSVGKPGKIKKLKAYNVGGTELLLTWKNPADHFSCIKTYRIEYCSEISQSGRFLRINKNVVIFNSFFVNESMTKNGTVLGFYRVAAIDLWNRKGHYSNVLHFTT
ncbi:alpha-L-iduronidase isoform X3 [Halyomorpha halys]|uniref:alpha-L-iduronidase isoform X3 n=1 Tax=Halyomorpha halys TaxID=286706 RepID=UPI0034D2B899